MSEKQLQLDIITPEGVLFSGLVRMVIATGAEGELGILPLHAPLITPLGPSELIAKMSDNTMTSYAVDNGYFEVRNDRVIVLVSFAKSSKELDPEAIEGQKDEAIKVLQNLKDQGAETKEAEEELQKLEAWLTLAKSMVKKSH